MTMTDRQIAKAWGANARIKDKVLQIKTGQNIRHDLDGLSVSEAIKFLSTLDPDASLDIYSDYEYGDHVARIELFGWQDVTPQKRADMIAQIEGREATQRLRDERELARLKAQRPDLFQ